MNADLHPSPQPVEMGRGAALKGAVTEAHVVLDLLVAPRIKELGITSGEADVLTVLLLNPDPPMPGQIAAQLNVTGAGTTGRLNSLERNGFIRRVPNPADGRSVTVHLTKPGEELATRVLELKNSVIEEALVKHIGTAAADELTAGLNRLISLTVTRLRAAEPSHAG